MAEKINPDYTAADLTKLAKDSLRKCYGPDGIYAGRHQFKDYWTRDSVWAGLGALAIGDDSIVKKHLNLIFSFERNGEVPVRIGNKYFLQTYFLWPRLKLYGKFPKKKVYDNGSLTLILLYNYYTASKDKKFVLTKMPLADKIVHDYLRESGKDWLIDEGWYAGWMDGLRKHGKVFYTNLLMYLGLEAYYSLCNKINYKPLIKADALTKLKQILNKEFWVGDHFVDWTDGPEGKYFDTFANLLAVYFGFASKAQANNILDYIDKHNIIREDGSIKKSFPNYPKWMTAPNLRLLGLAGYSEGITYPWMSLFYFACLKKMDKQKTSEFQALVNKLVSSKTIHECYTLKGKPYRALWYRSEHPFAWASGFALLKL